MSTLETINLTSVRSAIESYRGFTQGEKSFVLTNLDKWLGEECNLNLLEKNFEKLSLNVKPCLEESGLI